jgi:hypothetical protein
MSERRIQLTVRVEAAVFKAAKERAGHMNTSVSAAIAEAAKESLLSSYRTERETEILKAVERNFFAIRRIDQRVSFELRVLKEMLGLSVRSFLNHIPAVPDDEKTAALLSGKVRFARYLDVLAKNLRNGDSTLGEVGEAPVQDETVTKPETSKVETAKRSSVDIAQPIAANQRPKSDDASRNEGKDWNLFDQSESHSRPPASTQAGR